MPPSASRPEIGIYPIVKTGRDHIFGQRQPSISAGFHFLVPTRGIGMQSGRSASHNGRRETQTGRFQMSKWSMGSRGDLSRSLFHSDNQPPWRQRVGTVDENMITPRLSHQEHITVGRNFPGTPSVGNVVHARDHDAEPALSGPGEGARDPDAKSQIFSFVSIFHPILHLDAP